MAAIHAQDMTIERRGDHRRNRKSTNGKLNPDSHAKPATAFLCDCIRHSAGTITADQIRANWRAGKYRGIKPEWAAQWARDHGITIKRQEG